MALGSGVAVGTALASDEPAAATCSAGITSVWWSTYQGRKYETSSVSAKTMRTTPNRRTAMPSPAGRRTSRSGTEGASKSAIATAG